MTQSRHATSSGPVPPPTQLSSPQAPHLLSDPNIEGAIREALLKAVHARAASHGCMDAYHASIPVCLGDQGVCEEVGVAASLPQHYNLAADPGSWGAGTASGSHGCCLQAWPLTRGLSQLAACSR